MNTYPITNPRNQFLRTVFFGDSITVGGHSSDDNHRFSTLVSKAMGWIEINKGLSGSALTNTTPDPGNVVSGYSRYVTDIIDQRPARVVIQYGTNDMLNFDFSADGNPTVLADFTTKLTTIVNDCLAAKIEVILCVPPCMTAYKPVNMVLAYGNAVKQVGFTCNVPVIDTASVFYALADPNSLMFDGVHPLDAGHALIASTICGALNGAGKVDKDDVRLETYGGVSISGGSYGTPTGSPLNTLSADGAWTIVMPVGVIGPAADVPGGSPNFSSIGLLSFADGSGNGISVLGNFSGEVWQAKVLKTESSVNSDLTALVSITQDSVLAVTSDGTNWRMYVDGVFVWVTTGTLPTGCNFFGLGKTHFDSNPWYGEIRSVYAADRVLTADEIKGIPTGKLPATGTVEHLRLDKVSSAVNWRSVTGHVYQPTGLIVPLLPEPVQVRLEEFRFSLAGPSLTDGPSDWTLSKGTTGIMTATPPAYAKAIKPPIGNANSEGLGHTVQVITDQSTGVITFTNYNGITATDAVIAGTLSYRE